MPFVHPGLLWGLGAVSVPIVIHLLNRRRFQVVRWAAMDFLLQANRKNRRRVRIEHLLVLLLRCLAMALLALAITRPVATSGALMALPGVSDPIERVVILDDSGSMGHRTGRTSCFDRARAALLDLADDLAHERSGDFLTVVRGTTPEVPDLLLAPLGNERTDGYLRGLSRVEPSPLAMDVLATLEAVVKRAGAEAEGPRQRVVYLLTDLRRRDWLGPQGDLPRRLAEVLRKAPPDVRFLVVDVGAQDTRDLGITSVAPTEKLAMVGVPLEVVITVANRGEAAVFDVPLTLETGDARVPLTPIARIDPGQTAEVRHRTTLPSPGVHGLTVRLPQDALPLDDARHLALEAREALKVLLIDGQPGDGPLEGEADLLRFALAPPGDGLTGVEPTVIPIEGLRDADLSAWDTIVACNVEAWPKERIVDLERFVERGGGLAVFLGDQVDAAAWNRDLWRDGQGPLPCKIGPRVEAETEELAPQVARPEPGHPLVAVFQGDRNPFLKRVRARVRAGCEVDATKDRTTRVVLTLEDPARTPFIAEKPWGQGAVVLLNTSADLAWSSWPRDPSYPVTCQELVRLLAPASTAGRNVTCGQPLERSINPARFAPSAKLDVPGRDAPVELRAVPRAGTDALWFTFSDTRQAGIHALRLEPRQAEPFREPFAVNPDPAEGDLARADPAQVSAAMEGVQLRFVQAGDDPALLALSDGTRAELWRTCLLALALVLALEQVLAWRAAHHLKDDPRTDPLAAPLAAAA